RARNLDGIVEPVCFKIGLTDNSDARHGSASEFTFHSGERHRLVMADHLGLLVPGWKGNKNGSDQPGKCSCSQIESSLRPMQAPQAVKTSHGCNHERAGHKRRHLIV